MSVPDLIIKRKHPTSISQLDRINSIIGMGDLKGDAELLNKMISAVAILSDTTTEIEEEQLNLRYREQLRLLSDDLASAVSEENDVGVLVGINLFISDDGSRIRVPNDSFVTPIGDGHGAVDAMARFLASGGHFPAEPPRGYYDASYFLWLDDSEQFLTIMPESLDSFYNKATVRSRTIKRLEIWNETLATSPIDFEYVDVADAWKGVVEEFLAGKKQKERRGEFVSLVRRMEKAQAAFVVSYGDYLRASQMLGKESRFLRVIRGAQLVSNLATSVADLSNLWSAEVEAVEEKDSTDRKRASPERESDWSDYVNELITIKGNYRYRYKIQQQGVMLTVEELKDKMIQYEAYEPGASALTILPTDPVPSPTKKTTD